jgi:hypothetical protein
LSGILPHAPLIRIDTPVNRPCISVGMQSPP